MCETKCVDTALEDYFSTLTSQISAENRLKDAVDNLLSQKEDLAFEASEKGKVDEWDILDQNYICIKLRNAFTEIDDKVDAFKGNVSNLRNSMTGKHLFGSGNSLEEMLSLVLSIITELHQYHKAVADCLAPLVEYAVYRDRYPTKYEMKECSSVPITWKAVSEVNRTLRYGYGLSKTDLASILSWMHGEDLSESSRKILNQKVDLLIQTYKERLANLDTCEVDVPIAFQLYPIVLQDVLKDCCSPVESIAAVGQTLPTTREDLDTLILREIPRIQVQIGDAVHSIANPGKAFENSKQKMHAVRHLVSRAVKFQKCQITKEQLDLLSLKVLAIACISNANASARTAVTMAFGKANLIQVKPCTNKIEEQVAQITLQRGKIFIDVPSQWWLIEDSNLFLSLSRDINSTLPIATVDTIYQCTLDVKAELERRAQSLPVVRIQRCSGMIRFNDKKDQASKGLRKRLSRATYKLFNRKSLLGMPQKVSSKQEDNQDSAEASAEKVKGIDNLAVCIQDGEKDAESKQDNVGSDGVPVPPPRPRRKAKKKRKSGQRAAEEAKRDPQWFSSCRKLQSPETPEIKVGQTSTSVASFEELQEVIDFLSGSSNSSLCLSQPIDADKPRKKVFMKECQSTLVVDDQGKVSPSDSGIGSAMSVRSSASSIATGLQGSGPNLRTAKEVQRRRIDKLRGTENHVGTPGHDSNDNKETNQQNVSIILKDEILLHANNDSSVEDAEVKCYNNEEIESSSTLQRTKYKAEEANENNRESRTPTRKREESSSSDNEASVQDVIDDLKASACFLKANLEEQIIQNNNDSFKIKEDQINEKSIDERENLDADQESESAVVSDHHSYDADGSEESEENNLESNEESKSRSLNTLHGSTESLYYSAWTLNDLQSEIRQGSKENHTGDETADSFFTSGLSEPSGSESFEGGEDFHDCAQTQERLYQHFSSRFSWPAAFEDHLAAIWGDKGVQETENIPGEVWSTADVLTMNDQSKGKPYSQERQFHQQILPANSNLLDAPYQRIQRRSDESFYRNVRAVEEQWSQSQPAPRQQEALRRLDWKSRMPNMASPERGSSLHSSVTRLGSPNNPQATHPSAPVNRGWSSPGHPQKWSTGFIHVHGQSFGRPSSVPAQISRPFASKSPLSFNQSGFDYEDTGVARQSRSPGANTITPGAHPSNAQYMNWTNESGNETLLSGANQRLPNTSALLQQQQHLQARQQLKTQMHQRLGNKSHQWP